MFMETLAGGRDRFGMIAEDAVPGGLREPILKSIIHETSCACMGCHGLNGGKTSFGPAENSPSDTILGGVGTTATLSPGGAQQSVIDTAGDSDWFRITLAAGQTYTFTVYLLPGGLSDSTLTLRDANGTPIEFNDDANIRANLLNSEINFTASTSGTYYLDVRGYEGATGGYILHSSQPLADAAAGNASTTATLTVGAAATDATLAVTGDRDWYAVNLVAGQVYEIVTSATGGSNDIDTTLTLRDSNGDVLAFNDDNAPPQTYSRIRFVAETSGTYFVDVGGWIDSEVGDYQVEISEAEPLREFTFDEISDQLLNGYWGGAARRWDVDQGESLTVNLTGLTPQGLFLAREALNLWSDVLGFGFTEVTGTAQLTFQDDEQGAFATTTTIGSFINAVTINIGTEWLAQFGTELNTYSFQTYVHEIGHALGLGHGGNYNSTASYLTDALYLNDSWATTVMSYFDQVENTFFGGRNFSRVFALSPMQADIIALQQSYGSGSTTRIDDTVYGVGNTSGRAIFGAGFASFAVAIVDHGGNDTFNYSTFSASQLINLNSETFSNVGGSIGNLSIARGTIIENAISGAGSDTLIGNAFANVLTGLGGNDTLNGGSNIDTAVVRGNRSAYTVTQTSTGVFRVVGLDGTDTLTAIEFLQFDDQTIRLLPGTGVSVSFETADPAGYQTAMNAIRDFGGNALGGNGSWLRIGEADVNGDGDGDQILVNDAIGRFATVGTAPDGLVYFLDHSWAGETRVAGTYIDPLVEAGVVVAGSDNDSQRRFQNDLQIENINRVLGANDYDNDGVQEVFFALTDGTAYLRALMHDDGNIRYANYQSEQEVIDYLTANGFGPETWGDWFNAPSSASTTTSLAAEEPSAARTHLLQLVAEDAALPGGSGIGQIDFGHLGFGQPGFGAQFPTAEEFMRVEFYG